MNVTIESMKLTKFKHNRSEACRRGLDWDLQSHEYWSVITQDCFYCGREPDKSRTSWTEKNTVELTIRFNGLDRFDNDLGYTKGNVVSCCTRCNRMKMAMTIDEFFTQVSRIANLHKLVKRCYKPRREKIYRTISRRKEAVQKKTGRSRKPNKTILEKFRDPEDHNNIKELLNKD